jgi:hypothetical protein
MACCDSVAMAAPRQAASAPSAPLLIPPSEAALLAASLQDSRAEEPLAPDDPPRGEGTALYTLHSVFLI